MKPLAFSSIGLVVLLAFALIPFSRTSPEEKAIRARSKAEVLAYQVAQLFRESIPRSEAAETADSAGSRRPAAIDAAPAEGLMGQDPWGRAYSYKILPEGEKLRVEMRSAGPNGVPDLHQGGDDIVLILSL